MPNRPNTAEGFWRQAKVNTIDLCWEWSGPLDKDGYGRFSWKGKLNAKAHRVAWALENTDGRLPSSSELICHTCDNRKCVNPQHLYLGSPQSNMTDRDNRGRHTPCPGIQNGTHKLEDQNVRRIKQLYGTGLYSQEQLGERFGVSQSVVSKIVNNRAWRHIQ